MKKTAKPAAFDSQKFCRRRETAFYLGVSQAQVVRWERSGLIVVHRMPGIRAVRHITTEIRDLGEDIAAGRLSEPLTTTAA